MSFRDDFAKTPPGPQREQLVYRAIIGQGKPADLWPMTVDGPNGTKITYYITRDFLNADGVWVPMTGTTAQKIADYFGMYLPSNTIADQVWKAAKGKINVPPLSGTGYQGKDKYYSPQEVVSSRISATDAALAFSNKIQEQRAKNPNTQKELIDIGGGGKWITMPPASGSLGLHGIRNSDKPNDLAQSGYGTIHKDYENHSEYGSLVRLVDDRVDVQYPDGRKETLKMDQFLQKKDLRSALFAEHQDLRDGGLARYDLKRDKAQLAQIDKEVGHPKTDSEMPDKFEQITNYIDQIGKQISARRVDLLIHKYAANFEIVSNIGKDPAIKDLTPASIPGHAPEGFTPLKPGESSSSIGAAAQHILQNYQLGDQVTFKIGDQLYIGRSEPHYHPPPPEGADPSKYPKPWGWHRGVTVFKAKEGTAPTEAGPAKTEESSNVKGRMSLFQRITDYLTDLEKNLG